MECLEIPNIVDYGLCFWETVIVSQLKIWELSKWDTKTVRDFDLLLAELNSTPSSKIFFSTMIKHDEMYKPIKPGPFRVDYLSKIKGLNEYREAQRARIYLYEKDLVKVTSENGEKRLALTTRGHKIFYESYPLARLRSEKWDGNWVVVTYDLPQRLKMSRDYFRGKLKRLGFGSPQESLLVTPLPIEKAVEELVDGEKLKGYVWVIKAKRVLGMENNEVASRAWNLTKINGLYEKLLDVSPRIKKEKDKVLMSEWRRLFLALDLEDPYLPKELLPEEWLGEECRRRFYASSFKNLIGSLFSPFL